MWWGSPAVHGSIASLDSAPWVGGERQSHLDTGHRAGACPGRWDHHGQIGLSDDMADAFAASHPGPALSGDHMTMKALDEAILEVTMDDPTRWAGELMSGFWSGSVIESFYRLSSEMTQVSTSS